ncbi:hypothetical protein Tco_1576374 [Tanacetum coccineum]
MDQDLVHMVAASKVPMLKPGEYELWRMRMEQYIQMVDYALWEVIENGNTVPKITLVEGVEKIIPPTTTKEKAQRRLELKARSTLLMGIPNEYQLKFNSIKDAKSLLQAIEKSSDVLDQTFDRLQKLITQLEIHGETITQEDVNQKFLRTFVSSNNTSSTNGAVNTAHGATTVSTQATAINLTTIDDLSDVVICAFFASQPNSPQLDNEDLQQINPGDLEEIDLSPRWSVTTATKRDTLQGSAGLQGTKKTRAGKAQEEVCPSNSEVSTDSNCSSSCLENVKILKEQNEQLLKDLRTSKLNVIAYKTGLESVEARLLVYKKNESVYEEDIKFLKRNFMPPKHDLSFSGREEFMNEPIVSETAVKKPVVETSEAKASADKLKAVRKNNGAPIIEDWVSDSEEEDVPHAKKEKKTVKSSFAKIEFVKSKEQIKSPRKTTVKQGDQNRQNTHTPRGNQRN